MASYSQPRDPFPLNDDTVSQFFIDVGHPGYDDHNILLRFPALDSNSSTELPGLTFGVLATACGILADNRWDGYFTQSRDPSGERISLLDHETIPSGSYFYQLSDYRDGKWPLVSTIEDWRFPHTDTPRLWDDTESAELLQTWNSRPERDQTCHLTGSGMILENAHIVPKEFDSWFQDAGLTRYCSDMNTTGYESTDDRANLFRLRSDLHKAWDTNRFAITPKRSATSTIAWRIQALDNQIDLVADFHNRGTYIPRRTHIGKFLFARFAIQVFKRASPFFRPDKPRLVIRRGLQSPTSLSRAEIPELQPKSRSTSPRKRKSPTRSHTHSVQASPGLYASTAGERTCWVYRRKRKLAESESDSGFDSASETDTTENTSFDEGVLVECSPRDDEIRGRKVQRFDE